MRLSLLLARRDRASLTRPLPCTGFEDVWIRILESLEYVPKGGSGSEEDGEGVRA